MPPATEAVAVFGSSEPVPGAPLYELARAVGRHLAEAGYAVVTGGYGGVMEGACRGAREAGGRTVGVLCEGFRERTPNAYLTESVPSNDLHDRTRSLVELCRAYVVLHGKSGTLAELTFLWALHRAGHLEDRPVVLLGPAWRPLLRHLLHWEMLEPAQLDITRVVDAPQEVVDAIGGVR